MTCCCFLNFVDDETQNSISIDKLILEEARSEVQKLVILLLGASESGKSTVLKQIRLQYGSSAFSEEEVQIFKSAILHNVILITLQVHREMKKHGIAYENALDTTVSEK